MEEHIACETRTWWVQGYRCASCEYRCLGLSIGTAPFTYTTVPRHKSGTGSIYHDTNCRGLCILSNLALRAVFQITIVTAIHVDELVDVHRRNRPKLIGLHDSTINVARMQASRPPLLEAVSPLALFYRRLETTSSTFRDAHCQNQSRI
jgi:hypothetical protein